MTADSPLLRFHVGNPRGWLKLGGRRRSRLPPASPANSALLHSGSPYLHKGKSLYTPEGIQMTHGNENVRPLDKLALHAANPLLGPLGPYIETWKDWAKVLAHDPLKGLDLRALNREMRMHCLQELEFKFEPTRTGLGIAADLQDMMRSCLAALNPLLNAARIRQNAILAAAESATSLANVPWFGTPIQAKLIYGVTGLGKTHPVARFCKRLPDMHVHRDIPGWKATTQIMTLYVKMNPDGYRGPFLQSILLEVDRISGNEYSKQYAKERVDVLAVRVCHILVSHCLGLLVIDDINVKNFALSPERDAILLLFLKMLDFGIPIVFIANPLAVVDIESFSQDNRRITTNEPEELMPYDVSARDWDSRLLPSLVGHNLMEKPTVLTPRLKQILNDAAAGFPHYLRTTIVGVQKDAMRDGRTQVTEEMYVAYIERSKTLASARNLLEGFRKRDPYMLSTVEDVPWQEYGVRWGKISPEDLLKDPESGQLTSKTRKAKPSKESRMLALQSRAARRFLTEQSKKAKKAAANSAAGSGNPPEDVRNQEASERHVGALDELRRQAEREKQAQGSQ